MISAEQIKTLRERTGVSIAECKKALEQAGGDLEQALTALRAASGAIAEKKAGRSLGAGAIATYVHTTAAMGAMVELDCETDFVARNPEFKQLADDLAMHVAAFNPTSVEELLAQNFVKQPDLLIADLINAAIQKFGEKTEVIRLARFAVGE